MTKEHKIFDEVTVFIKAGNGGNGCASFRREKFIPDGGPNGGDGGKGGDILIRANENINTLQAFRYQKKIIAENGTGGMGNEKTGKSGKMLIVDVPFGVQIYDENTNLVFDITHKTPEVLLCKGGKGGLGNVHFKSSTNQAPREFTYGDQGEEGSFTLKLKIISDVGIIGMPNAGKSSFLGEITNANPKIGNYAFTTLSPNLGIMEYNFQQIVLADIPGLIEGAGKGHGLGHKFLKHVERTRMLVHLIDISNDDFIENYFVVRKEIQDFDEKFGSKITHAVEIIVLNKIDSIEDFKEKAKTFEKKVKKKTLLMSNFHPETLNAIAKEIFDQFTSINNSL